MIAPAIRSDEAKSTMSPVARLRVLPSPSLKNGRKMLTPLRLLDLLEEARRAAVLEERKKIARDLHDTLAQGFTGVIVQLEAADDALLAGEYKAAARHVLRAATLAREGLSETRGCVHGLRPQALEGTTLDDALRRVVAGATEGTSVHTSVQIRGRVCDVPRQFHTNLLHIAQEALSNTLKHARATSFSVRLSVSEKELRLEFRDNGLGLRPTADHGGVGLAGIRERVQEIGGRLSVISSWGGGTRIIVTRPFPRRSQPVGAATHCYPESGRNRCDFSAAVNSLACARFS